MSTNGSDLVTQNERQSRAAQFAQSVLRVRVP
ncbi:MAG: hypothetical protein RL605_1066, partial [Actinomycetota bacterium]